LALKCDFCPNFIFYLIGESPILSATRVELTRGIYGEGGSQGLPG